MAPNTPALAFAADPSKRPWEHEVPFHNRWHPAIPPVSTQTTNSLFRVECLEWTGGQIHDNDSAEDMKAVDLSQVRCLAATRSRCPRRSAHSAGASAARLPASLSSASLQADLVCSAPPPPPPPPPPPCSPTT